MHSKKNGWRKFIPYLDLYLEIPLISLRTSLLRMSDHRLAYDVVRLEWRVYKWRGAFNLYSPYSY